MRGSQRQLKTDAVGRAANDGYTAVARRPRIRGFDESTQTDQADRLEGFFGVPGDYAEQGTSD